MTTIDEAKIRELRDTANYAIKAIGLRPAFAADIILALLDALEDARAELAGIETALINAGQFQLRGGTASRADRIDDLYCDYLRRHNNALDLLAERDEARREVDTTARIIGDFMLVPPDGGDLKLYEGAQQMNDALEQAEAENKRLKAEQDTGALLLVVTEIRRRTGVGGKPMLSELPDAVMDKINTLLNGLEQVKGCALSGSFFEEIAIDALAAFNGKTPNAE